MSNYTRRALALTLVVAGGVACSDAVAPTETAVNAEVPAAARVQGGVPLRARGIDAEFTRAAQAVPGFGGMYFDRTGVLNVYATPARTRAPVARRQLAAELRAFRGGALAARIGRTSASGIAALSPEAMVVREGAYDFAQLQTWKERLSSLFGTRQVAYVDVDESLNRLRVGILASASRPAIQQTIARLGVPREAVLLTRTPPIRRLATVRDRVRPVPGGVQIYFPAPSQNAAFICTLGFNARRPGAAGNFFVTASHCSDIQGGEEGTSYYQPLPVQGNPSANRIGIEYLDPEYGNPGGLCEPGFRCRLSDALLARYQVRPDFGSIARTTFSLTRIGSLIIDPANPRWTIVGEFGFPFLGETAHKQGRTSGWTQGPVILTCADTFVFDTDIIQLCQDFVLAGVRPGDSGSPVFERESPNSSNVFLTGLLWGGATLDGAPAFVFSSMENIEFELGPLTTSTVSEVVASVP